MVFRSELHISAQYPAELKSGIQGFYNKFNETRDRIAGAGLFGDLSVNPKMLEAYLVTAFPVVPPATEQLASRTSVEKHGQMLSELSWQWGVLGYKDQAVLVKRGNNASFPRSFAEVGLNKSGISKGNMAEITEIAIPVYGETQEIEFDIDNGATIAVSRRKDSFHQIWESDQEKWVSVGGQELMLAGIRIEQLFPLPFGAVTEVEFLEEHPLTEVVVWKGETFTVSSESLFGRLEILAGAQAILESMLPGYSHN